jgi:hypothetical protein
MFKFSINLEHPVSTFGTTATQLLQLQDWLAESHCREVVLE